MGLTPSYNKLFKSDSQRLAFLLCVAFCVLGGMRELRHCVAHTLTGRYAFSQTCKYGHFRYSTNITMYLY
nr:MULTISPECIES: hypothetical protein [unclassified Vibrio]